VQSEPKINAIDIQKAKLGENQEQEVLASAKPTKKQDDKASAPESVSQTLFKQQLQLL